MPQQFDHLVLLVHDAIKAAEDFRALGFTLSSRADVGEQKMDNRFICFADGSYILLCSFRDTVASKSHRLMPLLAAGEGWADYSLLVPSVDPYLQQLTAAKLPVAAPVTVANTLADGSKWGLSLLMTGHGVGDGALPFLIEDKAGRQHRIPAAGATAQPAGATGIGSVTVVTRSLADVERSLAIVYGAGRPIAPPSPEARAAMRFEFGGRHADVLEVPPGPGEMGRYVAERGSGLFAARLSLPPGASPRGLMDLKLSHGARIALG